MSRHASVQAMQAPAQIWQCSASCVEHCRAQASQTSAHNVQSAWANSPPRASMAAHKRQTSAQSVHKAMLARICAGFCRRHAAAH
ncbi:hypothetical protein AXY46_12505 [Achromobacter xylosoxidans]|nr:hypothetical protein AXY46_12505 [Achromobacter xylosoxidans]